MRGGWSIVGQSSLPKWSGHNTLARVGLDEATAGLVRPLLLTANDAASAEGSAGLNHEWYPVIDQGSGTKGAGGCVAGLFDGNDRIAVVCTSVAKTASVIMSVSSGRPGCKLKKS